ncbi:MAG: molybdenum ABC transporter ATP-binding protein [Candidatus Polarisedimenticolia bacterium]
MSWRLFLDITVPLSLFELRLTWDTREKELGLFGPSGAGKTTVLESIAGLRRNVRGVIRVGETTWLDTDRRVNLPPERRGVGYVPQDVLLFPHLDVMGNVTAGARRARDQGESAFDPRRVLEVLELWPLRGRPVGSLSGGERQRVALARAVCSGPRLLMLDEPLASLDRPLRRKILPYLLRLREEFDLPTLYVSHETTEVLALTREVVVMSEGRLTGRGDPHDLLIAATLLPAEGLGEFENVMRGRVVKVDGAVADLSLAPGLEVSAPCRDLRVGNEALFALRADDVIIASGPPAGLSAQNSIPAEIASLRPYVVEPGHQVTIVVSSRLGKSDLRWTTLVTPRAAARLGLHEGMQVRLIFKAHACRLLGVTGTAV